MSFEIFIQCFDHGEPAGVPRATVRRLFPVVETVDGRWTIRFDDQNECEIYVQSLASDESLLTSMTISRPCAHPQLWEALLATMKLGSVVVYFPGDAPPMVASADAGTQLPPDMVEALGQPQVVTAAQEIFEAIRNA